MRDIMLDLETLGNDSDAAMVQLGACAFNLDNWALGPTFKATIPWASAMRHGSVDGETLEWWMRQSEAARTSVVGGFEPLERALDMFGVWYVARCMGQDPETMRFWANPSDFDHPILKHAYRATNRKEPWYRRSTRCMRTRVDFLIEQGVEKHTPANGVEHDALSDAIWQAERLSVMTARFRVMKEEKRC